MSGKQANEGAAQGAAPIEKKAGIQSEMEVGAKSAEKLVEEVQPAAAVIENPAWVKSILESNQAILDSNKAVIDSNQSVIDSLAAFKEHSADFIAQLIEKRDVNTGNLTPSASNEKELDLSANYHVTAGNEFRDPKDFTIVYSEGDDVTHLGPDKLGSLLSQGLVSPLPMEEY